MQTKVYSAYEARNKFGELLNLVYYQGRELIIERMKKPVAKLVPIKKEAKRVPQKIKFNPPVFHMGGIVEKFPREEIYDDYIHDKLK